MSYRSSADFGRTTWALDHNKHMKTKELFVQIEPHKKKKTNKGG